MKSLRRGTLSFVLATAVGAGWGCSSDSSPSAPAGSGSTSGSSSGSSASGSSTSGSSTSGSSTSGSSTSGSSTSGSSTSGSSTSGSATSGTSGSTGDDGGVGDASVDETGVGTETGTGGGEGGLEAGSAETGGGEGGAGADTFTAVYAILSGASMCTTCHATGGTGLTTGMLDMSTKAMAYTNLVGKPAAGTLAVGGGMTCAAAGGMRVVAGAPNMSLLLNKVGMGAVRCGNHMPRGGFPMLTPAQVTTIRTWIMNGALNN